MIKYCHIEFNGKGGTIVKKSVEMKKTILFLNTCCESMCTGSSMLKNDRFPYNFPKKSR